MDEIITLDYGSGGKKTARLIENSILPALDNPALRALLRQEDFAVQGFLCPGHVATILGAEGFRFLPEDYGIPAVVGGFEPQ